MSVWTAYGLGLVTTPVVFILYCWIEDIYFRYHPEAYGRWKEKHRPRPVN